MGRCGQILDTFWGDFCWTDWVGVEGRENGDQRSYPHIWLKPLGSSWDYWTSFTEKVTFRNESKCISYIRALTARECVCVCVCVCILSYWDAPMPSKLARGQRGRVVLTTSRLAPACCCSNLLIPALTACSPHAMCCAKRYQY